MKLNLAVVGVQTFTSRKFGNFVNSAQLAKVYVFKYSLSSLGKVYAHELQKFPLSLFFFFLVSFFKKIINESLHLLEFMLTKKIFVPNLWKFIPKISWILRTLTLFAWESLYAWSKWCNPLKMKTYDVLLPAKTFLTNSIFFKKSIMMTHKND